MWRPPGPCTFQLTVMTMIRFTPVAPLLSAALFLLGCSDYEMASDYGGAADSSAEQATPDSAPSSPDAPDSPPGSGPGGETAELDAAEEPGADEASAPSVPPSHAPPVGQTRGEPAAPKPRPAPSTPPRPAPSQLPSIKLSAGVALPQSLPTGTAMGFSVDYQFIGGRPGPSPYLWVIQPGNGQTAKQPVQLQPQGTLQVFILQFRPENGPFHTHIEDAQGNRLSPSLLLKGW